MDIGKEDIDDIDLVEIDMDEIEKTVQDLGKGVIPSQQVVLLKESIIKTRKEENPWSIHRKYEHQNTCSN